MRRLSLLIFLTFLLPTLSNATITLQECRERARENYPLVRKYALIQATKECNVHNASLTWLPRIELGGGVALLSNVNDAADLNDILGDLASMVDLSDNKERSLQYKVGATITQNIWDGGASAISKQVAKATALNEEKELEVSLYELQKQVDEVFFSVILLEERLEQALWRIKVLESNLSKMKTLHQEGVVTTINLKSMEAEVTSASQQISLIENNIKTFRMSLSLLTSMDLSKETLEVPNEPESIPVPPEYALLQSSRKLLELNLQKLNVDLSPKVGLFAESYYGYPGRNIFKSLTSDKARFNSMVGVELKFNLYPLYTRKSDKAIIHHKLQELDIQKDLLDFNTKLHNTGVSQEILFLRRCLKEDSHILQLRTEIRIAAEEALSTGVIDASQLLQKINEEAAAALQKNIHHIELLKALYKQESPE